MDGLARALVFCAWCFNFNGSIFGKLSENFGRARAECHECLSKIDMYAAVHVEIATCNVTAVEGIYPEEIIPRTH
jgi:hypothetical protein